MNRLQLIEANLALLARTTLQGAEVETYVAVTNNLHNERNEIITAAAATNAQATASVPGDPAPPTPIGTGRTKR
jgi:hypothetical protein